MRQPDVATANANNKSKRIVPPFSPINNATEKDELGLFVFQFAYGLLDDGLKHAEFFATSQTLKKKALKKSSAKKKPAKSSKKTAAKKTVKKRAAVRRAKPAPKKQAAKKSTQTARKPAKTPKNVAKQSAKKSPAPKPAPMVSQPVAPIRNVANPSDAAARKPVVAKAAVPVEPRDADLDEEIAEEDLELEGESDIEEEDVQEELDLDDATEKDEFIEKSEELLDDRDDYHNS